MEIPNQNMESKTFPLTSIPKELENQIDEIYEFIIAQKEEPAQSPSKICDEPLLFLGNYIDAKDVTSLKQNNIKYVLSLIDNRQGREYYEKKGLADEITWMGILAMDTDNYNMYRHFEETFSFIEEARKEKSEMIRTF